MMAIAAGGNVAGNAPAGAATGGDAPAGAAAGGYVADEANVVANDAVGGVAEAPQVPQSPPFSPVREPTPERQPTPERPLSPPPFSPETEWEVPDPVSPTFLYEEPVEFGPVPRPTGPDNYIEPEEPDVIISMKDDTIHGGFHVESPVRSNDAPKPTANAAGWAEDPSMLTILSDKLYRRKLVIADSDDEAEVVAAKEDDIDLDKITALATAALGPEQPAVPTKNVEPMEEQEEMEVPLTRKRSTYRRARTQFYTTAFARFRPTTSTGVPFPIVVPEPAALYVAPDTAGPLVPADKGKAPMPDLDIPAEFLAEDAQARKRLEEEQASERLVQQLRAEDLAHEHLPNISEQRQKELDELMMMNAMKERKKRALADLRYRALQNKPMKKSEVTEFMRAFVKGQWCAAHNATVSATAVSAAPRFTDSTVITTAAMDSAVTHRTEFFLDSDEEMPPGVSRVAAEPDFDDEVVAEILFRGKSISDDRVVFVDTHSDDKIADLRVKLETVSESTSSPPLTRRKHLGERVSILFRIVSSRIGRLCDVRLSTVHVLDLTNGKTVYMFMGSSYPIRATLLERMLHHRLTVPPSYCRHVRVGGIVVGTMAGTIIQTVQADLLQATMPVSSAPMS
nr:hypothetical protein [Tanacetum cinerariifolium]